MTILLALVPISVVLLGIAIWAFVWAVRRGQFDDLDTPALDILADEPGPRAGEAPVGAPASGAPCRAGAAPPDQRPDASCGGVRDDAD